MKVFLIFSMLILFNCHSYAVEIDKDRVRQFVEKYLTTLSIYMGNSSTGRENHLALLDMAYDPSQDYPCDLFNNETDLDFDNYLIVVDDFYKNSIQVDYEITSLSDCEEKINGLIFYYVFVKKTLKYEGKSKNVNLLISITLNKGEYKINQVEWLNKQNIDTDNCLSGEYNQVYQKSLPIEDINNYTYEEFKVAGDNAFVGKQYYYALENYKAAQKIKDDLYIKNQISKCLNNITCQSNFDTGERLSQHGDYKKAIEIFNTISESCIELKENAIERIKILKDKINLQEYKYFIEMGDNLFEKKLFKKSREAYLKALEYSPNDIYAKKKISECDTNGPIFAQSEINKAVNMAEASRKNFAEAFSIMYKYESSGILTGENYFFMANVLNGNDDQVGKFMNFSVRERHQLSKLFCIKSIEKGFEEAELMWQDTFNKKLKK